MCLNQLCINSQPHVMTQGGVGVVQGTGVKNKHTYSLVYCLGMVWGSTTINI